MAQCFALVFVVELALRLLGYGSRFFLMKGCSWNYFDLIVVTLQVFEEITALMASSSQSTGFSFLRILRVLRLLRILRLMRVLSTIQKLRTLVNSISKTIPALLWTMVLLMLMIYTASICFTQVVADLSEGNPDSVAVGTDTYKYYGSLLGTMMSLYQAITGGVNWRDMSDSLLAQDSPLMALLLCLYVSFAVLAMLNVITGVFVDAALRSCANEDQKDLDNMLREMVASINGDDAGAGISVEQFRDQLSLPHVQLFFKQLKLTTHEAKALLDLLDFDKTGTIDPEQFIAGCIRIHGSAKAIDLVTLMSDVHSLHRRWDIHAAFVERELQALSGYRYACSLSCGSSEADPSELPREVVC
jgi:hypothetical protein